MPSIPARFIVEALIYPGNLAITSSHYGTLDLGGLPSLAATASPMRRNLAPRGARLCVSGRSHGVEEPVDLKLRAVAIAGQRLRRGQHLRGGGSRLARTALNVGDVGRHLVGALCRLLNVAGNFLGRGTLIPSLETALVRTRPLGWDEGYEGLKLKAANYAP
jgi:hypothetical protein